MMEENVALEPVLPADIRVAPGEVLRGGGAVIRDKNWTMEGFTTDEKVTGGLTGEGP